MIKVNDYVRINIDNKNCIGIGRVSRIVNETIYVNMNNKYNLPVSFQIDKIAKHSKQLIDLIEVGDYVNESKVLAVMEDMQTGELHLEMTSNYTNEEVGDCSICDKDIKAILTKESYMANCYKVGGKE